MSIKIQLILYWSAIGCYVAAFIGYIAALVFEKVKLPTKASWLVAVGFGFHSAALLARWVQTGHAPYWGAYEVAPAYAWMAALVFLVLMWRWPKLRILGTVVIPIIFLAIGIGIMSSKELSEIPRTFFTFWLGVHIIFAKLAFSSVIISAGVGVFYLLKQRQKQANKVLDNLPTIDKLDYLAYRFGTFAFIMMSVMITSGAVWAYKAWGRYWGWDPIETWALISWLISALYLHLRRTMGWKGEKAAWLAIFTMLAMLFAFFGVPLFFQSIHEHL